MIGCFRENCWSTYFNDFGPIKFYYELELKPLGKIKLTLAILYSYGRVTLIAPIKTISLSGMTNAESLQRRCTYPAIIFQSFERNYK